LAEATSPAQSLGDSLITPELTPTPPPVPPPAPTTAQYSTGTIASIGDFTNLNIGFTVNLSSGDVHDGHMSGIGSRNGNFSISGGTGTVDWIYGGGSTTVQNFTGTTHNAAYTEFTIVPYTPGDASATINYATFDAAYGTDRLGSNTATANIQ
jgi:hypothetical protein